RLQGVRGRGRNARVRRQLPGGVAPRRRLRRPDLQGRPARGPAHGAGRQVRHGREPPDRPGPRHHDPGQCAAPGRHGDRVIDRRAFLGGMAAMAAARGAAAQTTGRTPRVGYVTSTVRSLNVDAFDQGLRDLGYEIGRNVVVEYRFGEGHPDRVAALVADVVRLKVDVLFAANPHAIRAARQASTTLPIVGIDLETDPIEAGWIKSLAAPGGNPSGLLLDIPELSGKQLQLLAEAMPRLPRGGVLWDAHLAR